MKPFWFIKNDFTKQRSTRIGASDIAKLIPNPEKPTESLAAWTDNSGKRQSPTAVSVWELKTGRTKRDPAGIPAEMGHWLEPKATELFMRPIFGNEISSEWLFKRMQFEILSNRKGMIDVDPRNYQEGTILHNTQIYTNDMITHPDGIYKPYRGDMNTLQAEQNSKGEWIVSAFGLKINLSKPFLVEAKSANFFAAKRPKDSLVTGYDFDLKTWQGIPLKNYVQIQFQLAMLDVDACYLPLISNTSNFAVWEIKADRKRQNLLIDMAGRLAWHIKKDIAPKEMAINLSDIKKLYPTITEDFAYVTDTEESTERSDAIKFARQAIQAKEQIKIWEDKRNEANDSLGVLLKDRGELKDENGSICKWTHRKGAEKIKALKALKKENELEYRYLKRKGLLTTGDDSKYVNVTFREVEE